MWESSAYGGLDLPAGFPALAAALCHVRVVLGALLIGQAILEGTFSGASLESFYELQAVEGSRQVVVALHGELFRLALYGAEYRCACAFDILSFYC